MKSLDYLAEKGVKFNIIELDEIPRTAEDVERLYKCPLGQVLKTLLFVGNEEPVLVVIQGDKKVNIEKLESATGQNNLRIGTPEEVKTITGYSIGGVSPFGIEDIKKIIDEGVFAVGIINIGSGKAEIGIEMSSDELRKAWEGYIADVS